MRHWEILNTGWIFEDIKNLLFYSCDNNSVVMVLKDLHILEVHTDIFMAEMTLGVASEELRGLGRGWSYRLNKTDHELIIIVSGWLVYEGSLYCPVYFYIYLKFSKIKS